jgi:energy-coupling factor transport system permease protein
MDTRGKPILKRLNSATKLLLTTLFSILVFIIDSPSVAAANTFFFIMLFICAKIPVRRMFVYYRFIPFLITLVVILQVVFGGGLITGLMIGCRIISLVIILPLLTMTTSTGDICFGITRLGFNYKTAYIITSALNILPSFQEEARQMLDARRLRRGAAPQGGRGKRNVFARFGEYAKIALPLVIKAMRRASAAGLAMDARAFGTYRARTWHSRTWPRKNGMSTVDFTVIAAGFVYAAIVVTANHIVKLCKTP